jgi:hypothetical protein
MTTVLSFSKGAQIRSLSASDYLCYGIQPFIQDVLDQFVETGNLERAILTAAERHESIAQQLFNIVTPHTVEEFSLKPEYLFPEANPLVSMTFGNTRLPPFLSKTYTEYIRDQSLLSEIHELLYRCGQGCYTYESLCQQLSEPMIALLNQLLQSRVLREQEPPAPEQRSFSFQPGVYRLQHATLLYRTATTGILVDPQFHSDYGVPNLKHDISRAMLEGLVDGILISHSHYDHWNYSSLMMFSPDTPIIVPAVPRGSITCEDMAARLRSLGFRHVFAPEWNSDPIQIGDIEVYPLPFYGEQPLVPEFNEPKHPDLRNWGNTYVLRTPYYSSWFLIDAGTDPMGSMTQVAETVQQRFGSIDWVLSNFQPLSYNSIGTDLASWGVDIIGNLLSNPQIFSVTNKDEGYHLATLGPKGVAEICAIVKAKACLPYAHSWAEVGSQTEHDPSLVQAVMTELATLGCTAQVIPWRIGDGYVLQGSQTSCVSAFHL